MRTVPCPRCGVPTPYSPANAWRPFCSERCRNIDLGNWASEAYRVPASPDSGSNPAPDDEKS